MRKKKRRERNTPRAVGEKEERPSPSPLPKKRRARPEGTKSLERRGPLIRLSPLSKRVTAYTSHACPGHCTAAVTALINSYLRAPEPRVTREFKARARERGRQGRARERERETAGVAELLGGEIRMYKGARESSVSHADTSKKEEGHAASVDRSIASRATPQYTCPHKFRTGDSLAPSFCCSARGNSRR